MTTVLCLMELDGAAVADASLRARSLARSVAGPAGASLVAVTFGQSGPGLDALAGQLAGHGVAELCAVTAPRLDGYAPAAWARALQQLAESTAAAAVVAAGTDHGSEVMAYLGAMSGLPVAANCVSAEPVADGWQLVRQRWAGSLLEEAVLEGHCALLTVATDAIAATEAAAGAAPPVPACDAELDDADMRVRAVESAEQGGGLSLATARH